MFKTKHIYNHFWESEKFSNTYAIVFFLFLVGAFLEKSARLLQWLVFLVGAFSLKEKSPTLTVSSFFFFS